MVTSEGDLTRLRHTLHTKIQNLLPLNVRKATPRNRDRVIVEEANRIASPILKCRASRPPTTNLALQTLTALYVSCTEASKSKLSYIVEVYEIAAENADVFNLTAILGALLIAAVGSNSRQNNFFTTALAKVVRKWPAQPDSWLPQHYVNIADSVSISASLYGAYNCLSAITTPYPNQFQTLSLPGFAVCAGLFNAIERDKASDSLIQLLSSEFLPASQVLLPISTRTPRAMFCADHIPAYCFTFIIASAGPKVAEHIPLSCMKTVTAAFENVISLCVDSIATAERDSISNVLHPAFKAVLVRFAAVHTSLYLRVCATTSALVFVKELTVSSTLTTSKLMFVRIFVSLISSCLTPEGNAHLLDITSYTETETLSFPVILIRQTTKCVARDMKALGLLATATLLVLEGDAAAEGQVSRRGLALSVYTSRALSARISYAHQEMFLCDGEEEEESYALENVWSRLAICLIKLILSKDAFNFDIYTNLLISLFGARDPILRQAKKHAVNNCLCTLLEVYNDLRRRSLDDNSQDWRYSLRCILAAVSGMAVTVHERSLVTTSLKKLILVASGSGHDTESVACICLLRYMQQCEVTLVDIAMNCFSDLVGHSKKRKISFGKLASEYILNMELGRKKKCLVWLLEEFNNFSSTSNDITEMIRTSPKHLRAKL